MWVAVVAMAQVVQGLDLPDVVGIARNVAQRANRLWHTWHGTENHGTVRHASQQPQATWPMLRQPQLLPKVHELNRMSGAETSNRVTYYWELFTLIFVVVVLLGTLIMVCGPRVKGYLRTKRSYLRVEVAESTGRTAANGNGQILGITSQKRLLTVAFGATLSACTVACAYSVQTERLSRTTGLDFEMYALLLAAGTVAWSHCFSMAAHSGVCLLIQAVFAVVCLPEGEEFGLSAFAEAAVPALAPIISDGFDTLKDIIFTALCLQSEHMVLKAFAEDLQLLKEALPYLARVATIKDFMQKLELQAGFRALKRVSVACCAFAGLLLLNNATAQAAEELADERAASKRWDLGDVWTVTQSAALLLHRGDDIFDATGRGDLRAVRSFFRRDPGSDDSTGALRLAASCGHADIVEFALSQNVDVDAVDFDGPGPREAPLGAAEVERQLRYDTADVGSRERPSGLREGPAGGRGQNRFQEQRRLGASEVFASTSWHFNAANAASVLRFLFLSSSIEYGIS
eukprot:s777_g55.t1